MNAKIEEGIQAILAGISPAALELATDQGNPELEKLQGELDHVQDGFDAIERSVQAHLARPTLVARIENDAALFLVAEGAPLEAWALPLIGAAIPVPGLSFGVVIALKVAFAVLDAWAKRRAAASAKAPT